MSYKITRRYYNNSHKKRTLKTGLTLDEAQAHCNDPNTSSSTATSAEAVARTKKLGPWFDSYEREK